MTKKLYTGGGNPRMDCEYYRERIQELEETIKNKDIALAKRMAYMKELEALLPTEVCLEKARKVQEKFSKR